MIKLDEKLSQERDKSLEEIYQKETSVSAADLEVIKSNIKNLDKAKYELKMILDSMQIENPQTDNKLMKEVSDKAEARFSKAYQGLEKTFEQNQDVLQDDIDTPEKLAEQYKDDAEIEDVAEYYTAKSEADFSQLDKQALQKRLNKLGVDVDLQSSSYEALVDVVSGKYKEVSGELIKEKLKTPDGRLELTLEVSKELKKTLPEIRINQDDKYFITSVKVGQSYQNNNQSGIDFNDEGAVFKEWERASLLPESGSDLKEAYDNQLYSEALKLAYRDKIHESLQEHDEKNLKSKEWLESLENNSEEQREKAKRAFYSFKEQAIEMANQAEEKIKMISETYKITGNYSINNIIDNFSGLAAYKDIDSRVEQAFDQSVYNKFPPTWDYKKLEQKIEKRSKQNQDFLDELNSLENQDDYERFFTWDHDDQNEKSIGNYYSLFSKEGQFDFRDGQYDSNEDVINAYYQPPSMDRDKKQYLLDNNQSMAGFVGLMEKVQDNLSTVEGESRRLTALAIDAHLIRREVAEEMKALDMNGDIQHVIGWKEGIEKDKAKAKDLSIKIANLKVELPNESLRLDNSKIEVLSKTTEWQELRKSITEKNKKLSTLKQDIKSHKSKEPKWFKSKWQDELTTLENQDKDLNEEIKNLEKTSNDLHKDRFIWIDGIDEYSWEARFLKQRSPKTGRPAEIFEGMLKELEKEQNKKFPNNLLDKYHKYEALSNQLGK